MKAAKEKHGAKSGEYQVHVYDSPLSNGITQSILNSPSNECNNVCVVFPSREAVLSLGVQGFYWSGSYRHIVSA